MTAPSSTRKRTGTRRWSKHVTQTSNALDLDSGVFARNDPTSIARSLKRSAAIVFASRVIVAAGKPAVVASELT
jgi:hypothetical protein